MSSRSETVTKTTPSEVDKEKAETVRQLRALLFPALTSQLSGGMTSASQEGLESLAAKGIFSSAAGGVPQGDAALLATLPTGNPGKNNALNMALQLYGYGSVGGGGTRTSTGSSNKGIVGAGINSGVQGYRLGRELYDVLSPAGETGFNYGAGIAQTGTEPGNQWLINDPSAAQLGGMQSGWEIPMEAGAAIEAGMAAAAATEAMAIGGATEGISDMAALYALMFA